MAEKTDLSQLDWLVDCRSKNQRLSLDLYNLLSANKQSIRRRKELLNAAQALVAVMFSLWRAVFLSPDAEGSGDDDGQVVLDDAEAFLRHCRQCNWVSARQKVAQLDFYLLREQCSPQT